MRQMSWMPAIGLALSLGTAGVAQAQGQYSPGQYPNNFSNPSWGQERSSGYDPYLDGYRMGREEERRRGMESGRQPMGQGQMGQGNQGGQDQGGLLILLLERERNQQALRDLREPLREARRALEQGNTQAARQALDEADRVLRQEEAMRSRQQLESALGRAEQALRRGDRRTAWQALQQARQAIRSGGDDGATAGQDGGNAGNSGRGGSQGQQGGAGGDTPAGAQPGSGNPGSGSGDQGG